MRIQSSLLFLATAVLGFALAARGQAPQPEIAVVVNSANSVDNLSHSDLRKIFAGERRSWASGATVRVFVRPPNTRERDALLRLLHMSESDYEEYWTTKIYRGEAQSAPVVLPSVGMTREAIVTYPGAITLVTVSDVKPGMKVLKIDSHLPGEAGYPLH
jgi:ABC-type phosphate transport system substrate-binding protein